MRPRKSSSQIRYGIRSRCRSGHKPGGKQGEDHDLAETSPWRTGRRTTESSKNAGAESARSAIRPRAGNRTGGRPGSTSSTLQVAFHRLGCPAPSRSRSKESRREPLIIPEPSLVSTKFAPSRRRDRRRRCGGKRTAMTHLVLGTRWVMAGVRGAMASCRSRGRGQWDDTRGPVGGEDARARRGTPGSSALDGADEPRLELVEHLLEVVDRMVTPLRIARVREGVGPKPAQGPLEDDHVDLFDVVGRRPAAMALEPGEFARLDGIDDRPEDLGRRRGGPLRRRCTVPSAKTWSSCRTGCRRSTGPARSG